LNLYIIYVTMNMKKNINFISLMCEFVSF